MEAFSSQVSDQLKDLTIAIGCLWGGKTAQSWGRLKSGTFGFHFGRLTTLCLRKLGGYDDQAQVDHEKRSNLKERKKIAAEMYNTAGASEASRKWVGTKIFNLRIFQTELCCHCGMKKWVGTWPISFRFQQKVGGHVPTVPTQLGRPYKCQNLAWKKCAKSGLSWQVISGLYFSHKRRYCLKNHSRYWFEINREC